MYNYTNELYHHGIKGQKWGICRYQNEDGSLTPEGVKRYDINKNGWMSKQGREQYLSDVKSGYDEIEKKHLSKFKNMSSEEVDNNPEFDKAYNNMIKDRRSYNNQLPLGIRKREFEQADITLNYKDNKDIQKFYRKKGVDTVIAMNKKGKMDLYAVDENGNTKTKIKDGWKIINSMDDIMNTVDLYELTKTSR